MRQVGRLSADPQRGIAHLLDITGHGSGRQVRRLPDAEHSEVHVIEHGTLKLDLQVQNYGSDRSRPASTAASLMAGSFVAVSRVSVWCAASCSRWARAAAWSGSRS